MLILPVIEPRGTLFETRSINRTNGKLKGNVELAAQNASIDARIVTSIPYYQKLNSKIEDSNIDDSFRKLLKKYDFYLVSLSCEFLTSTHILISSARLNIRLSAESDQDLLSEEPLIYSVFPTRIDRRSKYKRAVVFGTDLKLNLLGIESDDIFSSEIIVYDPTILGHYAESSYAVWDFSSKSSKGVSGKAQLFFIVRTPRSTKIHAKFKFDMEVSKRSLSGAAAHSKAKLSSNNNYIQLVTDTSDPIYHESGSKLLVLSSDPVAPLEVADNTGKRLDLGFGNLACRNLKPGFYRVRLIDPEGDHIEKLVNLRPHRMQVINLYPHQKSNSSYIQEIVDRANIGTTSHNELLLSDMDPIAFPQIPTILALASKIMTYDEMHLKNNQLRRLGIGSIRDVNSALQILFAAEDSNEEKDTLYFSTIKISLWQQDELAYSYNNLHPLTDFRLAQVSKPLPPGQYRLSIEFPKEDPIVFAISVLPQRLTLLIFHKRTDGQISIFQHMLPIHPSKSTTSIDRDLRLFDLLQRFYLSGRFDFAYHIASEIVNANNVDPLMTCLAGYTLLKTSKKTELDNILRDFKRASVKYVSDLNILLGEYLRRMGEDTEAELSFRKALDTGLPIFEEGLNLLYHSIRRYNINDYQNADLVKEVSCSRIKGILWSAWRSKGSKGADNAEIGMQQPVSLPDYGPIDEDEDYVYIPGVGSLPKWQGGKYA